MPDKSRILSTVGSVLASLEPVIETLLDDKPRASEAESAPLDAYTYTELPTSSIIRLLRLHSGAADTTICCSIRTVDLKDESHYIALSYSWNKDRSTSSTISHAMMQIQDYSFWILGATIKSILPQHELKPVDFETKAAEAINTFLSIPSETLIEETKTIVCDAESATTN